MASIEQLKKYWDLACARYAPIHKKLKLLEAADTGNLWKTLNVKFPPYQILPDTNFISYVKNNLSASIYTVAKGASLQPTSEKDKDLIVNLNIALERTWDLADVGYYQFLAGERAALMNIGLTQVGYDENVPNGIVLKNIDPMKFMRDPFAPDLDRSSFCIYYEKFHKSIFQADARYRDKFNAYIAKNDASMLAIPTKDIPDNAQRDASANDDYYTLAIFWTNEAGVINEYHTINAEAILYSKSDLKPKKFPFADLYCNDPGGGLVGTSECAKIFANYVAYNLLDSIALTAEYKNQRPPKFLSTATGLNVKAFAQHGDEADKTFLINGNPKDAVYYHQFPQVSNIFTALKMGLENGIENMSGVNQKYTGRNTGSITTTGGTEEMLNRVTIIDTPKILNYERYTRRLSELIISNLIQFAPKRSYFYRKPNSNVWLTQETDFPKISDNTLFGYAINISSELPKNKQRVADTANMLMEKQMQYMKEGSSVQLITEEEWLMFQDLPNKEYMLERMGIQRTQDTIEQVTQTLFQYGDLVKQGMDPESAIMATADSLKRAQMGNNPEIGAIPGATPQGVPIPGMLSN